MANYLQQLEALRVRALNIKKSLGTEVAARYLRIRGVSIHTARFWLAREA